MGFHCIIIGLLKNKLTDDATCAYLQQRTLWLSITADTYHVTFLGRGK